MRRFILNMGRFKRVSENEGIPQSIDRALFKTASVQEDPYAHLEQQATTRRAQMNREKVGYNEELKSASEKPWERLSSASVLNMNNFSPEDEYMSKVRPEDVSLSGVRRASYDVDNTAMAFRPNPTEMFNDPITVAMRGASMWSDMDEISDILFEMGEKDNDNFDRLSEREKQSQRVAKWEAEKSEELGILKNKAYARDRAHSIVKAHHMGGTAGNNDVMDMSFLDEREQQRLAMIENKRTQKLAIKANGSSKEESHNTWQQSALENIRAPKIQDYKNDWADELQRMIDRRG